MTTATLEKRLKSLEAEVQVLKQEVQRGRFFVPTAKKGSRAKKLPSGLQQALREATQGKLSGPFATVKELKAHLERR